MSIPKQLYPVLRIGFKFTTRNHSGHWKKKWLKNFFGSRGVSLLRPKATKSFMMPIYNNVKSHAFAPRIIRKLFADVGLFPWNPPKKLKIVSGTLSSSFSAHWIRRDEKVWKYFEDTYYITRCRTKQNNIHWKARERWFKWWKWRLPAPREKPCGTSGKWWWFRTPFSCKEDEG